MAAGTEGEGAEGARGGFLSGCGGRQQAAIFGRNFILKRPVRCSRRTGAARRGQISASEQSPSGPSRACVRPHNKACMATHTSAIVTMPARSGAAPGAAPSGTATSDLMLRSTICFTACRTVAPLEIVWKARAPRPRSCVSSVSIDCAMNCEAQRRGASRERCMQGSPTT